MHDDLPSEPVKYAVNPALLITALSLALWVAIEVVVRIALRAAL